MAQTTIYAASTFGSVWATGSVYATVAAGSASLSASSSGDWSWAGQFGQTGDYELDEYYFAFDTSPLSGYTVTAVELSLYSTFVDRVLRASTAEIYQYDWSAGGVTTADWRTPTQIGDLYTANKQCATFASSGLTVDQYNVFTSTSYFAGLINTSGTTYLMVTDSNFRASSAPEGGTNQNDQWRWSTYAAGTGLWPRLVVTYQAPPGFVGMTVTKTLNG